MLSAMIHKKPYLTRVVINDASPAGDTTWYTYGIAHGTGVGGVENEIDDNGGTKVANITPTTWPSDSELMTIYTPASGPGKLHIPWNARYNYRLGFGCLYTVSVINLYKNGSLSETQTYTQSPGYRWYHFGFNLDPSNRNYDSLEIPDSSSRYYPK